MKIKICNNGVTTEEYVEDGVILSLRQGEMINNIVNVNYCQRMLKPIHTKVFRVESGENLSIDICTDSRLKKVVEAFREHPNVPMLEFHRGDLTIEIYV